MLCKLQHRQRKAPHLSNVPPNHEIFTERKMGGGERVRGKEREVIHNKIRWTEGKKCVGRWLGGLVLQQKI